MEMEVLRPNSMRRLECDHPQNIPRPSYGRTPRHWQSGTVARELGRLAAPRTIGFETHLSKGVVKESLRIPCARLVTGKPDAR
jgi:hypothetical protein